MIRSTRHPAGATAFDVTRATARRVHIRDKSSTAARGSARRRREGILLVARIHDRRFKAIRVIRKLELAPRMKTSAAERRERDVMRRFQRRG